MKGLGIINKDKNGGNIMKKLISSFLLIVFFITIQDLFFTQSFAGAPETTEIGLIDDENTLNKIYQKSKELMSLLQENIKPSQYASTVIDASSVILHKFSEIFMFIVDKADKLTSKKFVLATLIAVGPLVAIYCKYFDPEPLRVLIGKFFSSATEGAIKLGSPAAKGAVEGALAGALEHKEELAEIAKIASEGVTQAGSSVASGIAEGTVNGILNNKVALLEVVALGTGINVIYNVLKNIIIQTGAEAGPYVASKLGSGLLFVSTLAYNKMFAGIDVVATFLLNKAFSGPILLP